MFAYNWVKHFAVQHNNVSLHKWADYWLTVHAKFNNPFKEFNNGEY